MKLTKDTLLETEFTVFKPISNPKITKTIYTDASFKGWDALYNHKSTGGACVERGLHTKCSETRPNNIKDDCSHDTSD